MLCCCISFSCTGNNICFQNVSGDYKRSSVNLTTGSKYSDRCCVLCAQRIWCCKNLNLHAFIVSLGTQTIAFGATCIYIDSQEGGAQALSSFNEKFLNFVNGSFKIGSFELPYLIIYFALSAAVMWVIWNKTTLGKICLQSVEIKSCRSIRCKYYKNIMGVYLVAGVLYGLAAFLEAGRIQSVNTGTGLNYDLDAISGCVIGGVSFNGGVGTIPGVFLV